MTTTTPTTMDPAATSRALETLSAGRLLARNAAPYFRAKLLSFVVRSAPGLGTIACTKRGIFLADLAVVAKWSAEQMAGGWIHEVMHSCLRHHDRGIGLDPEVLNMAQDLAINPAILDMGLQLPPGGLFPEKFGFERGLTSEEYYDLLMKQAQGKDGGKGQAGQGKGQKSKGSDPSDDGEGDEDGEGGEGDKGPGQKPGKPTVGGGWCGSCSSHAVPGEPDDSDPEGRSDAELERINRQVAEAIRNTNVKDRGTIPGSLLKWADVELSAPTIPWQAKLARATRRAANWAAGAVIHRYDAPGRRQAALGYGAGCPILPRLRRPVPQVAVAIDTSGSMGPGETFAAVSEVQGVLRAVAADVTFCACDAEVQGLAPIRTLRDVQALLKGGGGTDFVPVFEALDKAKPRPEIVIFMTDGYGPAPSAPPVGMFVIWVLVGDPSRIPYVAGSYESEVTYGEQITIPVGG